MAKDKQYDTPVENVTDGEAAQPRPRHRPLKYETVEQLDRAINAYFDMCDPHTQRRVVDCRINEKGETIWREREVMTEQKPYTISGLANALGVSRQTILNYAERPSRRVAKIKMSCYIIFGASGTGPNGTAVTSVTLTSSQLQSAPAANDIPDSSPSLLRRRRNIWLDPSKVDPPCYQIRGRFPLAGSPYRSGCVDRGGAHRAVLRLSDLADDVTSGRHGEEGHGPQSPACWGREVVPKANKRTWHSRPAGGYAGCRPSSDEYDDRALRPMRAEYSTWTRARQRMPEGCVRCLVQLHRASPSPCYIRIRRRPVLGGLISEYERVA
jgi:hypothetical protein